MNKQQLITSSLPVFYFEQWAKPRGYILTKSNYAPGFYANPTTESAWCAYHAAWMTR